MSLDLLRRKGRGSLDVKQPRFSGLQGESLDLAARWSGDVVGNRFGFLFINTLCACYPHRKEVSSSYTK